MTRYLGDADGEALFWKLAGDPALKQVWEKWRGAGADLTLFFDSPDIPRETPNVYGVTSGSDDQLWRTHVRGSGCLMNLARNPYMLFMLTQVYVELGSDLPANRGRLFDGFAGTLLLREHLATRGPRHEPAPTAEGTALLDGLARLAYHMQGLRDPAASSSRDTALTSLAQTEVKALLGERLLYLAGSASILNVGDEVRFAHQLLQEYFTARYMQAEVEAGRLRAKDIWKPDRWWERTNWEEATVLLAGLYSDDCTRVLDWVADANPEVVAQCLARSGAHTPDAIKRRLQSRWLPRLTDLKGDPDPRARAAVGRALGMVTLDGVPLDNRKGVSIPSPLPRVAGGGGEAARHRLGRDSRRRVPHLALPDHVHPVPGLRRRSRWFPQSALVERPGCRRRAQTTTGCSSLPVLEPPARARELVRRRRVLPLADEQAPRSRL